VAKRFTDTEKWKRAWFTSLSLQAKMVWIYILDDCDNAGIWQANFRRMSFDLDFPVNQEQFENWFEGKFEKHDDKYFFPSFVEFQYGELNENNNAHKSVLSKISKLGSSWPGAKQPLKSPLQGAQDTATATDTDKVKEKGGVGEKEISEFVHPAKKLDASFTEEHQKIRASFIKHGVRGPSVLGKIPEIVNRFGGVDELRSWFEQLVRSKSFTALDPKDRGRYIAKALTRESNLD